MTNPNQLCDVLLFVCSKMADETNLSSKLPIAERSEEESSVGDALALAFRYTIEVFRYTIESKAVANIF